MPKIIERTCLVCRAKYEKHKLLRFSNINDTAVFDEKQNLQGRGAYICRNAKCIEKCMTKNMLTRPLKTNVCAENYENIRKSVSDYLLSHEVNNG